MDAEVDVSQKDGKTLADAPRPAALAEAHAIGVPSDAADNDVRRVIAANMGKGALPAVAAVVAPPAPLAANPVPAVKASVTASAAAS